MQLEEDLDLEYSEDDSESETDVSLENQYYYAKSKKDEDLQIALIEFDKVIALEGDQKGVWGFRALKQIIKIHFIMKNYEVTMAKYKELLTYINTVITKNHAEKSINAILDYTSTSDNFEILQDFYEATLEALKQTKNDHLWFKTSIKLGKVYLDLEEFGKLALVLRQLRRVCDNQDAFSDSRKGTQLLEIYALQIQMFTKQKNHQQLKEVFDKAILIRSVVPHPLIMSVIRECGGKMYMRSGEFDKAYAEFFEAFKNYEESGNPRRTTCLKYLLLASMLMNSPIDPFDSPEAKPYKGVEEIQAMTKLSAAFHTNDMILMEKVFQENRDTLLGDPFIADYITDLLRDIRAKILLLTIKPYSRIKINSISEQLGISDEDAENLLVSCILDQGLPGRIDQVNKMLVMDRPPPPKIYESMEYWANVLEKIQSMFNLCPGGRSNVIM